MRLAALALCHTLSLSHTHSLLSCCCSLCCAALLCFAFSLSLCACAFACTFTFFALSFAFSLCVSLSPKNPESSTTSQSLAHTQLPVLLCRRVLLRLLLLTHSGARTARLPVCVCVCVRVCVWASGFVFTTDKASVRRCATPPPPPQSLP